ncbi:multi-sensor signal transduction histidine kinase : Histidine kinase OS=Calothrix sp. PCC 6303 GN=Cal6303_4720 PE=4 SV=1: PAS_9: PAS [Gemmata massiliana]|uniref:histidine kinase n=1 Tax=Gemmata massiliana TaxID=1210884 RepID=A0A6P2D5C5_9BACT|nr:PAS domain-containing protein [Gemmata massiliana]VTR95645.1 multi-sensor signal transduction histidine kinase : Histidine kinase OS=Calothrix sp. PCC 6303 GN=Cal6303_4720 PE=4 SV=1: PAS_9: PAS [Gemmata massiliana]
MTEPYHYRQAIDALPQLVWVASPDGTLEYLNRRCAEYSGLPIDDLLGWDWGWVVHPSDLPETLETWTAAVRAGTPHQIEHRLRRHDGEYRWFLIRAEPVRDFDGRVVRWFGTCTDIDEWKRTTEQFRNTRQLFRGLVERNSDGEVLVGADGTVRYANPATARLIGLTADELSGTDLWGSVHPDDRKDVSTWLERVLATPGERLSINTRFLLRDGSSTRIEVLATNLLPDPDVRALAVQLRPIETPVPNSPPAHDQSRASCS